MKKSFSTLLVALLASGTSFATTGVTGSITLSEPTKYAFIATSLLSKDSLSTIINTGNRWEALLGFTLTGGQISHSISVGTWNNQNELHIYNTTAGSAISGYAAYSFSDSTSWPTGHKLVNDFPDLTNAIAGSITLGYQTVNASSTLSGTAVVLSVLFSDGSITSIYGLNSSVKYKDQEVTTITYASELLESPQVEVLTSSWSKDSLIEANKGILRTVPEPTTATLSLLALAGLAARRRRRVA